MRRGVSAALVLAFLATGALGGDAAKKELERFQGTWKILKMEKEGDAMPAAELEKQRVVFTGNKFVFKDGRKDMEARIELGPSKKPATINLSGIEKLKDLHGIYKFEGDKLILCFTLDGRPERPREFVATKASGTALLVLQRAKK